MNRWFIFLAAICYMHVQLVCMDSQAENRNLDAPKNQIAGTLTYKRLIPGLWKVYRSKDDLGEWKNPYGFVDFVDADGTSLGCTINVIHRDYTSMTITATHTAAQVAIITQKYAEQKLKDELARIKNQQLADMMHAYWN